MSLPEGLERLCETVEEIITRDGTRVLNHHPETPYGYSCPVSWWLHATRGLPREHAELVVNHVREAVERRPGGAT